MAKSHMSYAFSDAVHRAHHHASTRHRRPSFRRRASMSRCRQRCQRELPQRGAALRRSGRQEAAQAQRKFSRRRHFHTCRTAVAAHAFTPSVHRLTPSSCCLRFDMSRYTAAPFRPEDMRETGQRCQRESENAQENNSHRRLNRVPSFPREMF